MQPRRRFDRPVSTQDRSVGVDWVIGGPRSWNRAGIVAVVVVVVLAILVTGSAILFMAAAQNSDEPAFRVSSATQRTASRRKLAARRTADSLSDSRATRIQSLRASHEEAGSSQALTPGGPLRKAVHLPSAEQHVVIPY